LSEEQILATLKRLEAKINWMKARIILISNKILKESEKEK